MIVLQSLALMDGKNADALQFVALDGLLMQLLLPCLYESINTCVILNHELSQIVEEGADVCTL